MALRTWRPLNSKVRGLPTLTESTRPSELAISPSFPPRGEPAARASHIRTARPRRSRSPGLDSKAMPPHARPEKERLAQPAPTRECRARDQVVGTERLHAGGAVIGEVRGVARGLFRRARCGPRGVPGQPVHKVGQETETASPRSDSAAAMTPA